MICIQSLVGMNLGISTFSMKVRALRIWMLG